MSKGTLKRSTTLHGIGAGATILAIVGGSLLGMQELGVPFGPVEAKEKVEEKQEEITPVAAYQNTQAYITLKDALSNPPGGWKKNGDVINSPQEPYPFSCVTEGPSPAIAFAHGYEANGKGIQVVSTAYTAGLGTAGIATQFEKAPACVSEDATMSTDIMTGLGAESYVTTVNKGGIVSRIVTWRNGDVVSYLIADKSNGNPFAQAQEFNKVLTEKLNPVCVNQDSGMDDLSRSIWSNVEFTGLRVNDPVSIPKVPLPEIINKPTLPVLGKDLTPKGFQFKSEKNIKPVALPGEEILTAYVTRPEQPSYPVWPPLPKQPELPTIPEAPTTEPPTSKEVFVKVEDKEGPGCGWAFTAAIPPKFDAETADAEKKAAQNKALAELKSEAASWQAAVLNYWQAYATYKQKAETWNKYAAQVAEVKAAWDIIAQKWATYNANLANYEASIVAREQFIENKAAAERKYKSDIEACKVFVEEQKDYEEAQRKYVEEKRKYDELMEKERLAEEEEARLAEEEEQRKAQEEEQRKAEEEESGVTPSPSPSESPTPTPTPTKDSPKEPKAPTPPTAPTTCPAERPAILDQSAPEVLPKPTPPADPRPADQRG